MTGPNANIWYAYITGGWRLHARTPVSAFSSTGPTDLMPPRAATARREFEDLRKAEQHKPAVSALSVGLCCSTRQAGRLIPMTTRENAPPPADWRPEPRPCELDDCVCITRTEAIWLHGSDAFTSSADPEQPA